VLIPLRHDFPALRIVLEHITTREAVQYVAQAPERTAATMTAHHLLYDRNAMFAGGLPTALVLFAGVKTGGASAGFVGSCHIRQ
jgi:dihydroorotase